MRKLFLDKVDSTNDYLKKLVQNYPDIADLLTVISYEQFAGRGRFSRKWFSNSESLIFSILLYSTENSSQLSLITANALVTTIREYFIQGVYIKWPNDVCINDFKVAGILLENVNRYIIIGIGVNVNQDYFPPDIGKPISLKMLKGEYIDKNVLYERFLSNFLKFYKGWLINPARAIAELKSNIGWIGRKVKVIGLNEEIKGIIEGIDINGFLMLKMNDGTIKKIFSGEISICLVE